jgi:hypothetical protein
MMSNALPWLPSLLLGAAWLSIPVLISLHPRFRNWVQGKTRGARPSNANCVPAAANGTGRDVHASRGAFALQTDDGRVVRCRVLVFPMGVLAVQTPLPISMTATPAVVALAVWGYLRPRGAVRSCYVDQNGAITLNGVTSQFPLTSATFATSECITPNQG